MSDEDAQDYLATTSFSDLQKKQVMAAKDREEMLYKVEQHRSINAAATALYEAYSVLRKQGIFVPQKLEDQFAAGLDLISGALAQRRVEFMHPMKTGDSKMDLQSKLFEKGPAMFAEVKAAVRDQLMVVLGDNKNG